MMATILFVDDEDGIRNALRRLFADSPYRLLFAAGAAEGLDLLRANECAVIVSDNRMPGENGIEFLTKARFLAPDTVRVIITAYADLRTSLNAINRSEAFRFVVKPWDDQELVEIVRDGVLRYELLHSLRSGDEMIFRALAQTIELKDCYTKGHCDRVVNNSLAIGRRLGMSMEALTHLEHGALLHDCGKIGIPEAILNFPGQLDNEQFEVVRSHPGWGADVARAAGLHKSVVNIILYHHEKYNGQGYPTGLAGEDIPLEARIVTIADVYDAMTSDRPYLKAMQPEVALRDLMSLSGKALDPYLVDLFLEMAKERQLQEVHCE